MGTKQFDKGMMTYQHDYGKPYTIPIYCWYLEGGDRTIIVDTGEMNPVRSDDREQAIGGRIYTFEEGLAQHGLSPERIDTEYSFILLNLDLIPPQAQETAWIDNISSFCFNNTIHAIFPQDQIEPVLGLTAGLLL